MKSGVTSLARRFAPRFCIVSLSLALAACGSMSIESKKVDYKSAGKAPSLEVPPDLVTPTKNDRFAVPDTGGKGSATYSGYAYERSPEAQATKTGNVLPDVANVHLERDGGERWLSVNIPREKLWGQVKDFWQDNGFIIKLDLPEAGVMETDWAENRAKLPQDFIRDTLGKLFDSIYSTGERDKFRTRFEVGSAPGTTDIFVSHRGMVENYVGKQSDYQTVWEPRPPDPELEAEFLGRLMVSLGADEKRAAVEMAKAQEKRPERARLQSAEGSSILQVQEPFDRTWRRVGLALDRVGFTVEDRDRAKGLYFVRYVDPESGEATKKDEGFWSSLAFWRSKQNIDSKTQYRIFVKGAGQSEPSTAVQVLTREGGPDNSQTAKKILSLLHDQLK